jgi:hypothetical protein
MKLREMYTFVPSHFMRIPMERMKRNRIASSCLFLFLLLPGLVAAQNQTNPVWSMPEWLWIRTYHAGTGFRPGANLEWDSRYLPYSTTLGFRYYLFTHLKSMHPQVMARADSIEGENFRAALWTGTNSDAANYEIQFLYSHGSPGGIVDYDSTIASVQATMPNNIILRKFNKYMFLMSCRTLENETPGNYAPVFKGGHALLGVRSDLRAFGFQVSDTQDPRFLPNSGSYSNRIGQYFSIHWVQRKKTLWDAWRDALFEVQYREYRFGVEAAGVFVAGHLGGKLYHAYQEKADSLYDGAIFLSEADMNADRDLPPRYTLLQKTWYTEGIICIKAAKGRVTYDNSHIML